MSFQCISVLLTSFLIFHLSQVTQVDLKNRLSVSLCCVLCDVFVKCLHSFRNFPTLWPLQRSIVHNCGDDYWASYWFFFTWDVIAAYLHVLILVPWPLCLLYVLSVWWDTWSHWQWLLSLRSECKNVINHPIGDGAAVTKCHNIPNLVPILRFKAFGECMCVYVCLCRHKVNAGSRLSYKLEVRWL